jgi:hypothetical protein
LSIRELDDGRVLVHDFAGCPIETVLGSVGLNFDALFPSRPIEHAPRERRPWSAHDVLTALVSEMDIISVIAGDMLEKREISQEDYERLSLARERIQRAAELAKAA